MSQDNADSSQQSQLPYIQYTELTPIDEDGESMDVSEDRVVLSNPVLPDAPLVRAASIHQPGASSSITTSNQLFMRCASEESPLSTQRSETERNKLVVQKIEIPLTQGSDTEEVAAYPAGYSPVTPAEGDVQQAAEATLDLVTRRNLAVARNSLNPPLDLCPPVAAEFVTFDDLPVAGVRKRPQDRSPLSLDQSYRYPKSPEADGAASSSTQDPSFSTPVPLQRYVSDHHRTKLTRQLFSITPSSSSSIAPQTNKPGADERGAQTLDEHNNVITWPMMDEQIAFFEESYNNYAAQLKAIDVNSVVDYEHTCILHCAKNRARLILFNAIEERHQYANVVLGDNELDLKRHAERRQLFDLAIEYSGMHAATGDHSTVAAIMTPGSKLAEFPAPSAAILESSSSSSSSAASSSSSAASPGLVTEEMDKDMQLELNQSRAKQYAASKCDFDIRLPLLHLMDTKVTAHVNRLSMRACELIKPMRSIIGRIDRQIEIWNSANGPRASIIEFTGEVNEEQQSPYKYIVDLRSKLQCVCLALGIVATSSKITDSVRRFFSRDSTIEPSTGEISTMSNWRELNVMMFELQAYAEAKRNNTSADKSTIRQTAQNRADVLLHPRHSASKKKKEKRVRDEPEAKKADIDEDDEKQVADITMSDEADVESTTAADSTNKKARFELTAPQLNLLHPLVVDALITVKKRDGESAAWFADHASKLSGMVSQLAEMRCKMETLMDVMHLQKVTIDQGKLIRTQFIDAVKTIDTRLDDVEKAETREGMIIEIKKIRKATAVFGQLHDESQAKKGSE